MLFVFIFAAFSLAIPQLPTQTAGTNSVNTDSITDLPPLPTTTTVPVSSPTTVPVTSTSTTKPLTERPIFYAVGTCACGLLMILTGLLIMFYRRKKFRAPSTFNRPVQSRPKSSAQILQSSGKSAAPSYSSTYQTTSITSLTGTAVQLSSPPPVSPILGKENRFSFLSNGSLANFEVSVGTMTDKTGAEGV